MSFNTKNTKTKNKKQTKRKNMFNKLFSFDKKRQKTKRKHKISSKSSKVDKSSFFDSDIKKTTIASKDGLRKEINILREALIHKDKVIEGLKKQNDLLLATTLKQSQEILDLKEKIKEFYNKK